MIKKNSLYNFFHYKIITNYYKRSYKYIDIIHLLRFKFFMNFFISINFGYIINNDIIYKLVLITKLTLPLATSFYYML